MLPFLYSYTDKAIEAAHKGKRTYCKFLSANDTGETGGHQAGFLISRNCLSPIFGRECHKGENLKKEVKIKWQDDFTTTSTFTYYGQGTRNEARLTGFGRGFPFHNGEYTGALWVMIQCDENNYQAYMLNSEENIDEFLNEFSISPSQTNRWINDNELSAEENLQKEMLAFLTQYDDFPETTTMSYLAQQIHERVYDHVEQAITIPDIRLVEWIDLEYMLFRELEKKIVLPNLQAGFLDIEQFLDLAKSVLNRRKSRAGKGFEHHLAKLFTLNNLRFETQAITELRKKPDFLFPSLDEYKNASYPTERIVSLAAKTTCKDRWRQIITECDRLKDNKKYLCTLQQGISIQQMQEMASENVVLVLPEQYKKSYAPVVRNQIISVKQFIDYIKSIEQ